MMMRCFFQFCFVATLLAIGACAQVAPPPTLAEITFAHLSPYQLAVRGVEVESRFSSSMTPPHVELALTHPPERVLRRWAADRLQATGGEAFARFIILDATVTEFALETDGTLTAVFTNEQALRYEAAAEALLEIRDATGGFLGNATARVTRTITIPENATLNEREQVLFDLVDRLMRNFDTELDGNIRTHLAQWVR